MTLVRDTDIDAVSVAARYQMEAASSGGNLCFAGIPCFQNSQGRVPAAGKTACRVTRKVNQHFPSSPSISYSNTYRTRCSSTSRLFCRLAYIRVPPQIRLTRRGITLQPLFIPKLHLACQYQRHRTHGIRDALM